MAINWMKTAVVVLAVAMVAAATETAWAQSARWARVQAFSTASWNLWANRGDLVTIAVEGDGDTDLDLYVYDDGGRLIASDRDPDDFAVVEFRVLRSSNFTIEVKNLGRVYNAYRISTSIR